MAKAKEVTTKFKVDVTDFKKGITEANNQIKLANAKFKEASSRMDDWGSSTDGLQAKIDQLNSIIEAQKTKISALKAEQESFSNAQKEAEQKASDLREEIARVSQEYQNSVEATGKNSDASKELKQELTALEKELNETVKAQEKNAKSAQNAEVQILNQQATLNKTERELSEYENALSEAEQAQNELGNSSQQTSSKFDELVNKVNNQEQELGQLKNEYKNVVMAQGDTSDEAQRLASRITDLSSELNENKSKLKEVEKSADDLTSSLDDVGNSAEESSDGFTVLNGALADLVSNAVQNVISGLGDLVQSFFELSEATEEYRSMSAKLDGSAKNNGYSIEFAREQFENFYGYVADDQMATNAITNLMGLGTSTETLSQLADGATAVWASYGDSIPIESLTEAINETIQVGKVTGTFADTINWAKISNEEMAKSLGDGSEMQKAFNKAIAEGETQEDAFSMALSATSDEQERADAVAKFLNQTYGESKKTYDEMTGSMQEANKAELELKETQAQIGEALEPLNSAFTELKNQALQAMVPIIEAVAKKFTDLKKYMEEHPEVAKLLEGALISLATAFGVLAGGLAIQGLINLLPTLMGGLQSLWAVISANPIMLIVSAIAGLVAGFMYLWNTSEEFRNFWIGLWENIKVVFDQVVQWINVKLQEMGAFFSQVFTAIGEFISTTWNTISTVTTTVWTAITTFIQTVINGIVTFITTAWNTISTVTSTVWNFISSIISTVWNAITSIVSTAINTVSSIISNVWNTISTVTSTVWNTISTTISTVWNTISTAVSTAVETVSSTISTVWETIKSVTTDTWEAIKKAIEDPITTAKDTVKEMIDKIVSFFDFEWSLPPLKLPHVSISGSFSLFPPSVPSFSVDWYAKGGVFDKPTILSGMGEDGAEAIVPLERNTQWINRVAKQMTKALDQVRFMDGIKDEISSFLGAFQFDSLSANIGGTALEIASGLSQGFGSVNNVTNSSVTNNTFNQYNTSPKALSKLEIYRQSKNLLNMKGR